MKFVVEVVKVMYRKIGKTGVGVKTLAGEIDMIPLK